MNGDPDDLAALVALDALDADERARAELLLGPDATTAAAAGAALAEGVAALPPADLRGVALEAALARRPALRPVDAVPPAEPADAFRRVAETLHGVVSSLANGDWNRAAHPRYGSVAAVMAHLVGVERLVLDWLTRDATAASDHVEATRAAIAEHRDTPSALVVERWYRLNGDVEAACRAANPRTPVLVHDLPTDVDGLLLLRSFELFAHCADICRAVDRPPAVPEPASLALMSSRLMSALPLALALRGTTLPGRTARIVLTGVDGTARAGGCYDVPLHPNQEAGPADVVITADVVDMCLLAAQRLPPAEVAAAVEGDGAAAAVVLGAAGAFARD